MNTTQMLCTLKDVRSFLGVFPSDMLPRFVTQSCTVIINADPHTEKAKHWLAYIFYRNSQVPIFSILMVSYRSSPT